MYLLSSKFYTHSNRSLFGWYVWSLYKVGFSISKIFNLRSILPTPVILRETEGEVAESIIHQITLTLKESSDRCRRWLSDEEEHFRQNS